MLGRCRQTDGPNYHNYRGKGIIVCDRWTPREIRGAGFANFLADMGEKPTPQHTLERKDSLLGYTPENCKWATRREQLLNTSRTRAFERDGVIYKASEVAAEHGISPASVIARFEKGLPFEEVISTHHLTDGYDHMSALRAKGTATILAKTHCRNGHELSGDNLAYRKDGWRVCRRCVADAQARYRATHAPS